jgi:transcriptional regulator with XRE-family HTH domain
LKDKLMPKQAAVASHTDVEIGARIRTARRERGLSQTRLGTAVGITFQQVQKYENGVNRVSVTRLCCIAEKLGLPLSYFVEGLGQQRRHTAAASDVLTPAVLLRTNDALKLVTAYHKIQSPVLRKRCVQLVQTLADKEERD